MTCVDKMTIGEAKEVARIFGGMAPQGQSFKNPVIGEYCIVRCYSAGVHAGTVDHVDGENVILKDSKRLWNWKANDGVALSGVAQTGMQKGCKIDVSNPVIYLTGVCEIIPCTKKAKDSIDG